MTSHPLVLRVGSALRADLVHSQVPGLGHQVPGSGIQHQVQVQALFGCLSPLHFCTRPRLICTFALSLSDQLGLWASNVRPLSPCHRAHVPPSRLRRALANWPTGQLIN